jgi:hypothetical protein
MKKTIFVTLTLVAFLNLSAHAFESQLLEMRNRFFQEAQEIKTLPVNPKNVVLVNSMWDSCLITMAQLDAYFSMLGIFNAVSEESASRQAAAYLISWLNEIKRINELNIRSLRSILQLKDPIINTHMEKLRIYYSDLNNRIDTELKKVSALSITRKPK